MYSIFCRRRAAALIIAIGCLCHTAAAATVPRDQEYVVIGWNDLGMHCMNNDFSEMAILPPFNNLWAQVIRRGSTPALVSQGVRIAYRFPANTVSSSKINFWTYAQALFGLPQPLTPDVGLTGNGLSGNLAWNGTAWEVTGVPVAPFDDAAPTVLEPYQLAELTLMTEGTSVLLDQTTIVAPVSVEMHCDLCHHEAGTATTEAILSEHEDVDGIPMLNRRPVLCAGCHASNALGTTGRADVPNLSLALHGFHSSGEVNPQPTCYDCHPGQQTQCLRDAMFQHGFTCTDCHGTLAEVAASIRNGREPWLDEPTCGQTGCHDPSLFDVNPGRLYRNSTGHGEVYCEACHNSPHAILPTVQPRDGLQMTRLQGSPTDLKDCTVCHIRAPTGPGPHGILATNGVPAKAWNAYR
ncbi:MAG: cytochrome c3 family protein [bacterium]|nr:cytochrome c3 family protein [bacterium]